MPPTSHKQHFTNDARRSINTCKRREQAYVLDGVGGTRDATWLDPLFRSQKRRKKFLTNLTTLHLDGEHDVAELALLHALKHSRALIARFNSRHALLYHTHSHMSGKQHVHMKEGRVGMNEE